MNSKGLTLLETLLVAVLLGFLALAGAQLMATQMKGQAQVLQKAEAIDLKGQLSQILGDSSNCSCQFSGVTFDDGPTHNPNGGTLPSLPNITKSCSGTKPVLIAANTPYESSLTGLAVKSIGLANIKPTGKPNQYLANLQVYWDERSTLSTYAPVTVPMRLQTLAGQPANAQKIISCGGLVVTLESVCTSLGGTFDESTQTCKGTGGNSCQGNDVPPPPCDGLGSCAPPGACGGQCPTTMTYGQYICGANGWVCLQSNCATDTSGGG